MQRQIAHRGLKMVRRRRFQFRQLVDQFGAQAAGLGEQAFLVLSKAAGVLAASFGILASR